MWAWGGSGRIGDERRKGKNRFGLGREAVVREGE